MARHNQIPLWWSVFVAEYLKNGENAKQAYLKARPKLKPSSAETNSIRLVSNAKFQAYLESQRSKICQKLDISKELVLKNLLAMGTFDVTEYLTENPDTKEIDFVKDWKTKLNRVGIQAVVCKETTLESGQVVKTVAIQGPKIGEKVKALETLSKLMGFLSDVNLIQSDNSESIVKALLKIRDMHSNNLLPAPAKTIDIEEIANAEIIDEGEK